jgi:hypothetical protein
MPNRRLKSALPVKLTLYLDLTVARYAAHMTPNQMRQMIRQVQQRPDLMENEAVQYALDLFKSYLGPEPDSTNLQLPDWAKTRRVTTRPQ